MSWKDKTSKKAKKQKSKKTKNAALLSGKMSKDVYDKDQSILAKYVFMADNLSNHHTHNLLDETDNKKKQGH